MNTATTTKKQPWCFFLYSTEAINTFTFKFKKNIIIREVEGVKLRGTGPRRSGQLVSAFTFPEFFFKNARSLSSATRFSVYYDALIIVVSVRNEYRRPVPALPGERVDTSR
jgi:hypothetical protein